jgi:hypothetical protein
VAATQATCDGAFQVVGVDNTGKETPSYTFNDNLELKLQSDLTKNFVSGGVFSGWIVQQNGSSTRLNTQFTGDPSGHLNIVPSVRNTFALGKLGVGVYDFIITDANIVGSYKYCKYTFKVSDDGKNQVTQGDSISSFNLCSQISDGTQHQKCVCCATEGKADCNSSASDASIKTAAGLWTAVGCIPTNHQSALAALIKIGLGVSGGVALLMILAASFMLTTSQGQPEQVNKARELITSSIVGLLFIIFSVSLLQFIGVQILQIPGFGK